MQLVELIGSERDLLNILQFWGVRNKFQMKCRNDLNKIKNTIKVLITADDSRNVHKMDPNNYVKLLNEEVKTF